ncbi:MAG: TadE/TadG family type IV pilus assembly protein [Bryobacteraceae bacterium]
MSWLIKIRDLLNGSGDRRRTSRFRPAAAVYYWTGEQVKPYPVRDIGASGIFVETSDCWGSGTSLHVHLLDSAEPGAVDAPKFSLLAEVVRREQDGMGMMFLFENSKERKKFSSYLAALRSAPRAESGHSLIEFALLLPLLFLLLVNAVNFGTFFYAWITMAGAARSGSQYASLAGATVGSPSPATSAQIYSIVAQDIVALPNRVSLGVRFCTNNAGVIACQQTGTGTFTNPPADTRPEANFFVMSWVDVQYTYQPLIPAFHFPGLGIHGTLPPTTIRRQTVMRRLQ